MSLAVKFDFLASWSQIGASEPVNRPEFYRGSIVRENGAKKQQPKYSPEVIEHAVHTVSEAGSHYES